MSLVPAEEDYVIYLEGTDSLAIQCYKEDVQKIAVQMQGAMGLIRMDAKEARNWPLR